MKNYSARWTHLAVQAPIKVILKQNFQIHNHTEFPTITPLQNPLKKGPTWPFDPHWVLLHIATGDFYATLTHLTRVRTRGRVARPPHLIRWGESCSALSRKSVSERTLRTATPKRSPAPQWNCTIFTGKVWHDMFCVLCAVSVCGNVVCNCCHDLCRSHRWWSVPIRTPRACQVQV